MATARRPVPAPPGLPSSERESASFDTSIFWRPVVVATALIRQAATCQTRLLSRRV
jgi:hypothetical protein